MSMASSLATSSTGSGGVERGEDDSVVLGAVDVALHAVNVAGDGVDTGLGVIGDLLDTYKNSVYTDYVDGLITGDKFYTVSGNGVDGLYRDS